MKTFFHPLQRRHQPQSYLSRGQMRQAQEVPQRIDALLSAVRQWQFPLHEPADHGMAPLEAVHQRDYLEFLQHGHEAWLAAGQGEWGDELISNIFVRSPNAGRGILAQAAKHQLDGSCPIGADTWLAAYWSAQSAVSAAAAVQAGERFAYALCRPPGHHARPDGAGGFCYLNNAAIAAESLRPACPRIAILDTDMHHGQGTQDIFYARDDTLFVSIHGDPTNFYPVVAGFADECGAGAGQGHNLNLPLPHGSDEEAFFRQLEPACAAIHRFQADVLVLSLGFDIYQEDPQSKIAFSSPGFARLGRRIAQLRLPTVIVQEGGYHLDSLGRNAGQFFSGLLRP
ncbi:histone deacetylase family protein [Chromobacterium sp. Beijing]|uniref:histone deacetylase family protein n=1 Tax=Chromobacterium sp. Beijing TaxID=2735795 RepID=UPI001F410394|nr:histone deacetylase family protein [Chromobacterium sp. Beijing]UJB34025.1 histone deacetylase family protein [Chromobacterium sp. Beijing]